MSVVTVARGESCEKPTRVHQAFLRARLFSKPRPFEIRPTPKVEHGSLVNIDDFRCLSSFEEICRTFYRLTKFLVFVVNQNVLYFFDFTFSKIQLC